ncbi:sensor histidine kinase [Aliikangiella sp. IMCC44359]|uniref:sensor histidine kinase n=1 Tax=Aliikangiella sp. IMCC44359 TaxID=3459125 RepID=UPI00403B010E
MKKQKNILKQRLWFCFLSIILIVLTLVYIGIYLNISLVIWLPIIFLPLIIISRFLVNYFYQPFQSIIESIETGLNCFKDNDFSINIADYDFPEFAPSIQTYNQLAHILRQERMELHQRELLLDTVIQSTPMAIVLTSNKDNIVYSNIAAKKLLKQTQKIEGLKFSSLLCNLPKELAIATQKRQNGLYSELFENQKNVFYLTFEEFNLNSQLHHLYLYKNMTTEVNKEELLVWKKVIRLISHELNNSLTPIQSLAHSANKILSSRPQDEFLIDIFETIQRRTKHLHQFIEKYAKFSRLPKPQYRSVEISKFINDLEHITQIKISNQFNQSHAQFDASQIEQVMINLIKNARESKSSENDINIQVSQFNEQLLFSITDRGVGMTDNQLKQSLLPFYTTKSGGSGLGLALCKEIISAHNGQLRLFNRKGGGLSVEFNLPIIN